MITVLENNKSVNVEKERIVCRAIVCSCDFNDDDFTTSPARFFTTPVEFVGIATLKEGDKDNVREAIRIAESKMERQYYKYIHSRFKKDKHYLESALADIDNMVNKTGNNIESVNKHIKDIVARMD